ncbi:hypothetical protein R1T16_17475 [Flavobacterium sp. DG1-102-2]|uniref:hypothetical protein n=1 Tax=Flavobacterium sp. DG1-102-2 TaxID=3081663 RepID=UPI00294A967C|nr:hypothetical protein [Flavobacterium sp. DG1-102-2]MDV6170231.1 hypothetical protein [Flavobacterium sp. DG1-102-2]
MFRKIILIVVLICFSCFLSSCRVARQEVQKTETSTETLTEKKETYRDTTLYAPKSETSLTIPLSDLVFKQDLNGVTKPKVFTQKSGNATAKVSVIRDTIRVETTCDSLAIVAKIKSEFQKESNNQKSNSEKTDKKTTGYTWLDMLCAAIIGVAVGLILCFQILKPKEDELT